MHDKVKYILIVIMLMSGAQNFAIAKVNCSNAYKTQTFVKRFYREILEREGGLSGIDYWTSRLLRQAKSASDIARGFIFSSEFKNKHKNNGTFVRILYKAFFNRNADPGGYNYWVGQLNGGVSRHTVVNGFLGSSEFVNLARSYNLSVSYSRSVSVNAYPIANAGPDITSEYGKPIHLSAWRSNDANGVVCYWWEEGNTKHSTQKSWWKKNFTQGIHNLTLTVVDGVGMSRTDTLRLHITPPNKAPIIIYARANHSSAIEKNYIKFTSYATDSDGIKAYFWKEGSEVLSNSRNFTTNKLSVGKHTLSLFAKDNKDKLSSKNITVTIRRDDAQIKAFVERFYKEILGRTSDTNGLNGWVDNLYEKTKTGADVAYGFIYSKEFIDKNVDNSTFLMRLYKAFFNRTPDTTGWKYWINKLDNGTSREYVLNGFIYAAEFESLAKSFGILPFRGQNPTPVDKSIIVNFVKNLYQAFFQREADAGGLSDWVNELYNDTQSAEDVVRGFLFGPEGIAKSEDGERYVRQLYAMMGRTNPSQDKINQYVKKLNNGTSKYYILKMFIYSEEFGKLAEAMEVRANNNDNDIPTINMVQSGHMLNASNSREMNNYWVYEWVENGSTIGTGASLDLWSLDVGHHTITLKARNRQNNIMTVTGSFYVEEDTIAPVITLNGDSTLTIYRYIPFLDPGVSAQDDRDGTVSVQISGNVNTSVPTTYTITYRATDAKGNTSVKHRTVIVSPEIRAQVVVDSTATTDTVGQRPSNVVDDFIKAFLADDTDKVSELVGRSEQLLSLLDANLEITTFLKHIYGHTYKIEGTRQTGGEASVTISFVDNNAFHKGGFELILSTNIDGDSKWIISQIY